MRKDEILAFIETWMKLGGIMLSKVSHTEKIPYCTWSCTYMQTKDKKQGIKYNPVEQNQNQGEVGKGPWDIYRGFCLQAATLQK